MGYIELLIVLEVISLNEPLVVRSGIKGEETNELCKLVLKKNAENRSEHVNKLIKEAFNHEKEQSKQKNINDMTYEEKLKSLENIFKKPLSKQSGFKSVFKNLYF